MPSHIGVPVSIIHRYSLWTLYAGFDWLGVAWAGQLTFWLGPSFDGRRLRAMAWFMGCPAAAWWSYVMVLYIFFNKQLRIGPAHTVQPSSCHSVADYTPCPKKNIPVIFDRSLKTNCQISIIFGKNIPDTTCHQTTIQFPTSPNVCFCTDNPSSCPFFNCLQ